MCLCETGFMLHLTENENKNLNYSLPVRYFFVLFFLNPTIQPPVFLPPWSELRYCLSVLYYNLPMIRVFLLHCIVGLAVFTHASCDQSFMIGDPTSLKQMEIFLVNSLFFFPARCWQVLQKMSCERFSKKKIGSTEEISPKAKLWSV